MAPRGTPCRRRGSSVGGRRLWVLEEALMRAGEVPLDPADRAALPEEPDTQGPHGTMDAAVYAALRAPAKALGERSCGAVQAIQQALQRESEVMLAQPPPPVICPSPDEPQARAGWQRAQERQGQLEARLTTAGHEALEQKKALLTVANLNERLMVRQSLPRYPAAATHTQPRTARQLPAASLAAKGLGEPAATEHEETGSAPASPQWPQRRIELTRAEECSGENPFCVCPDSHRRWFGST